MKSPNLTKGQTVSANNSASAANATQQKKGQKREEGWKEVVRKSKKVVVPANAISRVIGRGGCNINTIREISGAHIEVEKQKGQGDRMVIIKGAADATRNAQQLIAALSKETEKDLSEIIKSLGLTRPPSSSGEENVSRSPSKSSSSAMISPSIRLPTNSGVLKSASSNAVSTTNAPSTSQSSSFSNKPVAIPVRPATSPASNLAPFSPGAWNAKSNVNVKPQQLTTSISSGTNTKSTVSYTMAVTAKGKNTKTTTISSNVVSTASKVITTSETKPTVTLPTQIRPARPQAVQPFSNNNIVALPRVPVASNGGKGFVPNTKQPFSNLQTVTSATTPSTVTNSTDTSPNSAEKTSNRTTTPEYTPFNNLFSKVAQPSVWGLSKDGQKPNFASVAASGLSTASSPSSSSNTQTNVNSNLGIHSLDQELSIDANPNKAPGYRANTHVSPSTASLASTPSSSSGASNFGLLGSGPRSAPCTPPLASHTSSLMSNSYSKNSNSPAPTTTPPLTSQQSALLNQQQRQFVEPQNNLYSHDVQMGGTNLSSIINNYAFSNLTSNNSNHTSFHPYHQGTGTGTNSGTGSHLTSPKLSQYNHGLQRNFQANNSTYNSVPSSQTNTTEQNVMFGATSNVQSNLNPNAPDFSARNSSLQNHINGSQRVPSYQLPTTNQQQPHVPLFHERTMRALIAESRKLENAVQQQAAAAAAAASRIHFNNQQFLSNDFNPPTSEALRLLSKAINISTNTLQQQNQSVYGMQQPQLASNYRQQNLANPRLQQQQQQQQQQRQQLFSPKNLDLNLDSEEKKIVVPIGTERAQRKNPSFSPNSIGSVNMNSGDSSQGLWPFTCDEIMGQETSEWINQQQQQQQQTVQHLHSMHSDVSLQRIINDDIQHLDQSYQVMNFNMKTELN